MAMSDKDRIAWWPCQVRGWKGVPDIQRMFREFNRKFFGGRLPKTEIFWAIFKNPKADGCASEIRDENKKRVSPAILISWGLVDDDSQLKITMLHEMVHVEADVKAARSRYRTVRPENPHGPKFWARMNRLMKDGAFKKVL